MVVQTATAIESPNRAAADTDEDGLEIERDDPREEITHPFNPEKIKIRTGKILVAQLVSRIAHNEIDLAPDFQRMRGIWDIRRKSQLVESIMLKIPIPVFYVAEDREENWMVVDGIQRMTTINDYVTGEFELAKLEYLTELSRKRYANLSRHMQRRIGETELVVNVIEPGTPPEVMFNVFRRINTGGLTLNGQEIRHALHPGLVREYLKSLAESDEFIRATDNSVKPDRMADRECVLRFLAFYIEPWEKYDENDINGYLGKSMDKINAMSPAARDEIASEFKKAMRAAFAIFGKDAFRKPTVNAPARYKIASEFKKAMRAAFDIFRKDAFRKPTVNAPRRSPISKALFESWSVALARSSPERIAYLVEHREETRRAFIALINEDSEFEMAVSYSTSTPRRVKKRFEAIDRLVEELVSC